MNKIKEAMKILIIPALVGIGILILNTQVIYLGFVPSESMEDTIMPCTLILGNRLVNDIERGDIAIFEYEGEDLIKRVIGIPGDTIRITSDKVYINGKAENEEYIKGLEDYTDSRKEITLLAGKYFMMGDHRDESYDSRYIGAINKEDIVAKFKTKIIHF